MNYLNETEITGAIQRLHLCRGDLYFFHVLVGHFMIEKRLYGCQDAEVIREQMREEIWTFVCEQNKKEGIKR